MSARAQRYLVGELNEDHPMRAPEFEASLHDAALYPQAWRIVLGVLLTLFIWMGGTALILAAATGVVAA
ncbi:MAG: hypothetical protein AAF865_11110, partial [Pseudomonadota bacterium]